MTTSVYSLIIIAFEFVYYIQSANISELCSNIPFDGGMNFRKKTLFFKGSNVWRMTDENVDEIEGPIPINTLFKGLNVSSIDAAFHLHPNIANMTNNTHQMQFLAFLIKGQHYYIFTISADNTYYLWTQELGVPFKLQYPMGNISVFKNSRDDRTINAVFFDRTNYRTLFFVETDLYVMSGFQNWTNTSPILEKKKMITEVGVENERIITAIDFDDKRVMLIFGEKYCFIKGNELKCNKMSINSYFKCNATTDTSSTDPPLTGNATTIDSSGEQKDGLQSVVVIVVIGCAVFAVVLILSVLLFCCVLKGKKGSKSEKQPSLNANNPSITHDSRSISGASDYSTFSGAFGPKK